jgi:hypothetical protein
LEDLLHYEDTKEMRKDGSPQRRRGRGGRRRRLDHGLHGWAPIGSRKSTGNLRLRLSFSFSLAFRGRSGHDTGFVLPRLSTALHARSSASLPDGFVLGCIHPQRLGITAVGGGVVQAPIRNSLWGFMRTCRGVAHIRRGSFADWAAPRGRHAHPWNSSNRTLVWQHFGIGRAWPPWS